MTGPRGADYAIIGAGILGLATARALLEKHADASVILVEKEPRVAAHQSSHNSGVLHSGIYYRPGSLKARLCVDGRREMVEWCRERGVSVRLSGKLVVATRPDEIPPLEEVHRRALANGVEDSERLGPQELADYEPHVAGIDGLWLPTTGVVDFRRVAEVLAAELKRAGVVIASGAGVVGVERSNTIGLRLDNGSTVFGDRVIACSGLQSDRLATLLGLQPDVTILPFRGEYWRLARPELVRSMIYPVPDPRFPFLGVHFTRRIDNAVDVGPNALLALAREGYRRQDVNVRDVWEMLKSPALWRLGRRHWRAGVVEFAQSLVKPLLVRSARRLVPGITASDLVRAGSGVRAQAVAGDGSLVDDFAIADDGRVAAVLNAPSPAATASFAIGRELVNRVSP